MVETRCTQVFAVDIIRVPIEWRELEAVPRIAANPTKDWTKNLHRHNGILVWVLEVVQILIKGVASHILHRTRRVTSC
jgi:hypothetical protein